MARLPPATPTHTYQTVSFAVLEKNAIEVARSLVEFLKVPGREASFLKATPYAFGTLPIRVAGDIFGHSAHGLAGTLIVEPKFEKTVEVEGCEEKEVLSIPGRRQIRGNAHEQHPEGCPIPNQFQSVAGPWSEGGVLVEQRQLDPCRPGATCDPIPAAKVREHTLLWQDGLNLWSRIWSGKTSRDPVEWGYDSGIDRPWDPTLPAKKRGYPGHPLPNCTVCDDSYDLGEKGVSYRSAPFARRLAGWSSPLWLGLTHYSNDKTNLNAFLFPSEFFRRTSQHPVSTPRLLALPGEQLAIRVAHPAGRARQRSFLLLGHGYEDLLPGFGSGHAGLLGPGKALTASLCAARVPQSFLYRDGPQHIFASGVFGHLDVRASPDADLSSGEGATVCTAP